MRTCDLLVCCRGFPDHRLETHLPRYRIYFLGKDDRVAHAVTRECETDAEAIDAVSRHHTTEYSIELWDGSRFVKRLPPKQ